MKWGVTFLIGHVYIVTEKERDRKMRTKRFNGSTVVVVWSLTNSALRSQQCEVMSSLPVQPLHAGRWHSLT